ncbi:MAG: oligosaccharide flippase family protein [Pseudomonadota bacterium]
MKKTLFAGLNPRSQRQLLTATKAIVTARLADQVCTLVSLIVITRFLSVDEFGAYALIYAPVFLVSSLSSTLWRESILSHQLDQASLETIVSSSIPISIYTALLAAALAFGFGGVFPEEMRSYLLPLLGCALIIVPVASAFSALVYKQHQYTAYTITSIISAFLSVMTLAGLLYLNLGIVALAAALCVHAWVQAFAMIVLSGVKRFRGWHPYETFSVFRYVFQNVHHATGHAFKDILGVVFSGALFGPAGAGFYQAAETVVRSVTELVVTPLRTSGLIFFRPSPESATSPEHIRQTADEKYRGFLPIATVVIVPVFAALILKADTLVEVLLGPSWQSVALIATVLISARLIEFPVVAVEPVLKMVGRVNDFEKHQLLSLLVFGVAAFVARDFGLGGIAFGAVVSSLYLVCAALVLQQKHAPVDWLLLLRTSLPAYCVPIVVAVSILTFGVLFPSDIIFPQTFNLIGSAIIGAVSYLLIVMMLGPRLFDGSTISHGEF